MGENSKPRVVITLDDEANNRSTPSKSDTKSEVDTLSVDTATTGTTPSRSGSIWSVNVKKLHMPRIPPMPMNMVFSLAIFSLTSYVVDVATDIIMVYLYYAGGSTREGSLTLVFVILPCVGVLMDKFYRDSFLQTCTCSKERMKEVLRGFAEAFLIFFITVKICSKIVYHAWSGYWNKTKQKMHRSELEKLQNDSYGIRFYESTFEALPQLILQTILTMEGIHDKKIKSFDSEILRFLTILSSLVSISWGISSYVSRSPAVVSNPFTCYQMSFSEKILNFLAHVFVLAANVIAVSLARFGEFYVIGAVLSVRCLVMVTFRKCDREKKVIKNFSQFVLVLFGICVPSDDGAFHYTYMSYILIFICDFVQNTVFVAIWYEKHEISYAFEQAFIIGHYASLILGIVLMFLFYWRRYANIRTRRKSIYILDPVTEDDEGEKNSIKSSEL